ncbi:MAG: ribonuclease G [Gammaproteobacteria bacterium]|nr:ribonuclease G [Gammaproteobacteria bacterium]MDH5653668.1 ribonuclease G [Gammaproteobacteria bacterium]
MSEELLINITPQETRVAFVENGVLQEVHIERALKRGLVGNIYKGKVSRILPGMQAAFIEVGLDRTAFLHASDIIHSTTESGVVENKPVDNIINLLRESQEIIVQVIKDPMGSKGARLTTQLSIPSRYLVFLSGSEHIGVSQKIESEQERERLKEIVTRLIPEYAQGGYIVRTVAEGVTETEIRNDMHFLQKLWNNIQENAGSSRAASLIHEDLPLVMRTMRDLGNSEIEKIRIDSRETYEKVKKFAGKFIAHLAHSVEHYPGERPIFDLYGIEDEIRKALERKVQLKSGGYLIIDQTEAMTTIDVNTGAFVGHRNLEETIFKTNLEASQAIVRQLRLRNLGGIIIIDFIDMIDPEHRRQVIRALEKNLEKDHAKTQISEVSSLGLVEMTRKRTRESLEHILCKPCPACNGRGSLLSAETVCYEIFREIMREARQFDAQQLLVLASQTVVDMLVDEESTSLAELEEFIGKPIKLQVESEYTQEQFDVVLM